VEQTALAGAAPYWRQVLAYCAAGNLEAVFDEYLHHVAAESQGKPMDADRLWAIVEEASKAIGLRGVTYQAKDPVNPKQNLKFSPRFALRYGGRKTDAEDVGSAPGLVDDHGEALVSLEGSSSCLLRIRRSSVAM